MLQYLNENDWKEFVEKHDQAYKFLLQRNLEREFELLDHLKKKSNLSCWLNDWQKKRHAELKKLFDEIKRVESYLM